MDYETLYVLYQSRKVLLEILAGRGYNTKPFEKISPVEIAAMDAAGSEAFRMDLERNPSQDAASAPPNSLPRVRVLYSISRIKNRIASFIEDIADPDNDDAVNPETTEVIVMLLEPIADAFHAAAYTAYSQRNKLRISFFQAHSLVINPLKHVDVPKHELMPAAEVSEFLAKNKIKSKSNLPIIKFHEDMIARIMGLVPGDIVKITRPSPSAGEYTAYRLCWP